MNARIFKKKCKQAVAKLIKQHGFKPEHFINSEAGESWAYHPKFVRKFPKYQRFHYRHTGKNKDNYIRIAKGTPLYHWFDSYAGDGDAYPAIDMLEKMETDWSGMEAEL